MYVEWVCMYVEWMCMYVEWVCMYVEWVGVFSPLNYLLTVPSTVVTEF